MNSTLSKSLPNVNLDLRLWLTIEIVARDVQVEKRDFYVSENRPLWNAAIANTVEKDSRTGRIEYGQGIEPLEIDRVTIYGEDETDEQGVRLRAASLTLKAGEWLTVVGVNGSGKSTLARLLAGLLPERMSGVIRRGFAGEGVSPIVLQQPKAQLFGETPREEIVFALEWRNVPAERMVEAAEQALRSAGLTALADESWERLSGGQRQMAAFAAATAFSSPLLVMDEATSMLDEDNRDAVMRRARELHSRGTAVVWVTQRLDELSPDDRVVAVQEGCIVYDGDGREFLYGAVKAEVERGWLGTEEAEDGERMEGDGASESDMGHADSALWPLSPCLRAGLRLPYLMELALELRRLGKLRDPLPMTEREWEQVWGNAGHG